MFKDVVRELEQILRNAGAFDWKLREPLNVENVNLQFAEP